MKKAVLFVLIASFVLVGCSPLSTQYCLAGKEFRSPFVMSINPENAKEIEFMVFISNTKYRTVGVPINKVLVIRRLDEKQYNYNSLILGGASDASGDKYKLCLIIASTEEERVRIYNFIHGITEVQIHKP